MVCGPALSRPVGENTPGKVTICTPAKSAARKKPLPSAASEVAPRMANCPNRSAAVSRSVMTIADWYIVTNATTAGNCVRAKGSAARKIAADTATAASAARRALGVGMRVERKLTDSPGESGSTSGQSSPRSATD